MTRSGRHFEAFADHTLLKHAILDAYLQSWAYKILQWRGAGDIVHFVDGFAGPGCDNQGNQGSPVIACRIARQVRAHLESGQRPRNVRLNVVAVEADPKKFTHLENQLAPFKEMDPSGVATLLGSVSDHIGTIAAEIGPRPTLFFLDPFGLKGLKATTYPVMLAGAHNEIFALFHDIGAARLRGVVHADVGLERQLRALRRSPALFPELDAQEAVELEAKAGKKRRAVQQFGDAARAAITNALGDAGWVEELRDLTPTEAREELVVRFMGKLVDSGAKYVQVLPMRGASGGHKYCLVHASKSPRGYTAMKEAVSGSLNKDDLSPAMRKRMREDLRMSVSEIVRLVQERFGGTTVRWSGKRGHDVGTLKRILLEETSLFGFQCPEIKDELRGKGWLRKLNNVEQVVVPAA